MKKLFRFPGGIEVPQYKEISITQATKKAKLPARLVLPLHQHIGAPAEPIVAEGEIVLKGQKIAHATDYVSAPIHAPTSGTVSYIGDREAPHPSGMRAPCIEIIPDGKETWVELTSHARDYTALDPSSLRNVIREAGIVGLGGAGFPSYIKLNPGPGREIETLIINGIECEPYITCDDMLMRERADEIVAGVLVIQHALQAKRTVIAIEDNKPEAIESVKSAIKQLAEDLIDVAVIPTIYPAGSEKQLVYAITGEEVPSEGLPVQVGVVCQNIGTVAAVYRAVHHGEPLISRYVTITGDVDSPQNLEVLFGTIVEELVAQCSDNVQDIKRLIIGGPMMGFAMHSLNIPLIKTSNCVLVDRGRHSQFSGREHIMPCIRCGACAQVCPIKLLPQQLYWYAKAEDLDQVQNYNLFDCIECGCCDYVCPSHIPLVQYYRFAKGEIWQREEERLKSDKARLRHEFRERRIERDKQEAEERRRLKKEALHKKATNAENKDPADEKNDPKKAAILAAMERVREKKSSQKINPKNTDNLSKKQHQLIDEIDERRKRQRQDEQQSGVD